MMSKCSGVKELKGQIASLKCQLAASQEVNKAHQRQLELLVSEKEAIERELEAIYSLKKYNP